MIIKSNLTNKNQYDIYKIECIRISRVELGLELGLKLTHSFIVILLSTLKIILHLFLVTIYMHS